MKINAMSRIKYTVDLVIPVFWFKFNAPELFSVFLIFSFFFLCCCWSCVQHDWVLWKGKIGLVVGASLSFCSLSFAYQNWFLTILCFTFFCSSLIILLMFLLDHRKGNSFCMFIVMLWNPWWTCICRYSVLGIPCCSRPFPVVLTQIRLHVNSFRSRVLLGKVSYHGTIGIVRIECVFKVFWSIIYDVYFQYSKYIDFLGSLFVLLGKCNVMNDVTDTCDCVRANLRAMFFSSRLISYHSYVNGSLV